MRLRISAFEMSRVETPNMLIVFVFAVDGGC